MQTTQTINNNNTHAFKHNTQPYTHKTNNENNKANNNVHIAFNTQTHKQYTTIAHT